MSSHSQEICWVVTAGVAGMENQCLGLAAALGFQPIVKRVVLRPPFKQLAPFWRFGLSKAFAPSGDLIAPPWPDVMIASGRAGAMACLLARQELQGKTLTVYIQNPVISPSFFDLVAVPCHDRVKGENVVSTRGSLHRVTPSLLAEEAKKFLPSFSSLPSPLIAVLIGGSNSTYRLTPREMVPLATQLVALAKSTKGSLLITTSRRTGADNVALLKKALSSVPHVLWAGEGPNPYYAFLGLAESILVTADSVNMTSEACATGKPVHIIPLEGGSGNFRRFHQTLQDDGFTRPFCGRLEKWDYTPLSDVELVAERIKDMREKRKSTAS